MGLFQLLLEVIKLSQSLVLLMLEDTSTVLLPRLLLDLECSKPPPLPLPPLPPPPLPPLRPLPQLPPLQKKPSLFNLKILLPSIIFRDKRPRLLLLPLKWSSRPASKLVSPTNGCVRLPLLTQSIQLSEPK